MSKLSLIILQKLIRWFYNREALSKRGQTDVSGKTITQKKPRKKSAKAIYQEENMKKIQSEVERRGAKAGMTLKGGAYWKVFNEVRDGLWAEETSNVQVEYHDKAETHNEQLSKPLALSEIYA